MTATVTLGDLLQLGLGLIALLGGLGGLVVWLNNQFKEQRVASEEGRRRLYERVEKSEDATASQLADLRRHLDENYIRRDTHDVEIRGVRDSLTELHAIVGTVSGRVCPYPPDKP